MSSVGGHPSLLDERQCRRLEKDLDVPQGHVVKEAQAELFGICRFGSWQDISNLLTLGATLDCSDAKRRNLLHHATIANNYDVAQNILQRGGKTCRCLLFRKAKDGNTPLILACMLGRADLVRLFLSHGAPSFTGNSRNGRTPLHVACLRGHGSIVRQLLRHKAATIKVRDKAMNGPLHLAVFHGRAEVVRTLLENEADVNCRNRFGATPLHRAVLNLDHTVLELILQKHPDLGARDISGRTPLHLACVLGNEHAVNMLIACGASVNTNNSEGLTPLHSACENRDKNIVKLLISAKACVNPVVNKETPLYRASKCGYVEIVELLLDNHAKIFVTEGWDPLLAAVSAGHEEIVRMLTNHHSAMFAPKGIGCTLLSGILVLLFCSRHRGIKKSPVKRSKSVHFHISREPIMHVKHDQMKTGGKTKSSQENDEQNTNLEVE